MEATQTAHIAAAIENVPISVRPLFEATWSYREFVKVMPFGEQSEGQAYAHANPDGRVSGERISGEYFLVQYPRWRADEVLLPDSHGYIRTQQGRTVMTRAAGYGVRAGPDRRTITHWMRFVADGEHAWMNSVVAAGAGAIVGEIATVRYVAVTPARRTGADLDAARRYGVIFTPLATARYTYTSYQSIRSGDAGRGFGVTTGEIADGELAGAWRGWHYPILGRDGLELDAHAEIRTREGIVLTRHRGLARPPSEVMSPEHRYDVIQYATFATAIPALARLNETLAIGVGRVIGPRDVVVSYYAFAPVEPGSST